MTPAAIREARLKLGLTQHQLAQRLGVTRHSIANWERGRARPSREHRRQLAQVLGLPLTDEHGDPLPWQPSDFASQLNHIASALDLSDADIAGEALLPIETVRSIRDGRQPSLDELRAIVRVLSSKADDVLLDLIDLAGWGDEAVYGRAA